MRFAAYAAFIGLALALAACSGRTVQSGTPAPSASPNETQELGTGHIELTGSVTLSHDFVVKGCWVSAPGSSVLNGYSVTIRRDPVIESGGVLVKTYDRDGSYPIAQQDMFEALAIFFANSASLPRGAVLTDARHSSLGVSIDDNGADGTASFLNWSGGQAHSGEISGRITWKCGAVRRT